MKNKRMFFKYFGRYCLIFIIVLISSSLLVVRAYQIAERNVLEENTWKLQSSVDRLENQLSRMNDMSETLQTDGSLNYLKAVEGKLKNREYVYLTYLQEQLKNINILYEFASTEFMLFKNNDCYVSNSQAADSFEKYYGQFFYYDDLNAKEFKNLIFSQPYKISLIPCNYLKYSKYGIVTETKNPLLCIIRPSLGNYTSMIDESTVIVFVIEQETILDLFFQQKEKYDETALEIYDNGNQRIFQYIPGKERSKTPKEIISTKDYQTITYAGPDRIVRVTAGFSRHFVRKYIMELLGMLILYVIIGLVAAVIISLILAGRQYRNMHNLISDVVSKSDSMVCTAKNEYDLLSQSFAQMAETRNEYKTKVTLLENQMKNSILENALLQGVYTEDSRQKFTQLFPMPIEYYCVAVTTMNTEKPELFPQIFLSSRSYLNYAWNEKRQFLSILSGTRQEIFLIFLKPDDVSNLQALQKTFEKMHADLTQKYTITFSTGLSAIGNGLENLHICYRQAQQVLQAYEDGLTNVVGNFYQMKTETEYRALIDLEFLQKLYNLILCAETPAIENLFDRFLKNYKRNAPLYEMQKEETFYAIKNIVFGLLGQHIFTGYEVKLPNYRADQKFERMVTALKDSAVALSEIIKNNKKSRNFHLKNKIIEYLTDNFKDSGLTAAKISQDVGISEKYLYQFMKEQTGFTFAAYLERLRLEYAELLLTTTALSNAAVAEQSGFGSENTFYRVFSKNKGISPGKYRGNFT